MKARVLLLALSHLQWSGRILAGQSVVTAHSLTAAAVERTANPKE
jgi:hypothetical protein